MMHSSYVIPVAEAGPNERLAFLSIVNFVLRNIGLFLVTGLIFAVLLAMPSISKAPSYTASTSFIVEGEPSVGRLRARFLRRIDEDAVDSRATGGDEVRDRARPAAADAGRALWERIDSSGATRDGDGCRHRQARDESIRHRRHHPQRNRRESAPRRSDRTGHDGTD